MTVIPRKLGKGNAYKAIASALRKLLEQKKELFHSLDDAAVYLKQRVKLFARSPAGQAGQYTPSSGYLVQRGAVLG
jgi:hypothetical protein